MDLPRSPTELARRGGQLPGAAAAVAGRRRRPTTAATTTVGCPLRDAAAVALVRRLLAEVDDALLLALPALREIEVVEPRARPRVVADAARLAGRPPLRAAGPRPARRPTGRGAGPTVLVADLGPARRRTAGAAACCTRRPPTDEPLDLPALLLALVPARPDPPPRRARPAHRLPRRAGRGGLRRAGRTATDDPLALRARPRCRRARSTARCAPRPRARSPPRRCCATASGERVHPRDAVGRAGADERRTRGARRRAAGPGRRPPRAGPARRTPAGARRGRRRARRARPGAAAGGTASTPRWPPRASAARRRSVRCRCRSPTVERSAARGGCCCPADERRCRTASSRSGCGWCTPRRRTRCCSGWAQPRRPPAIGARRARGARRGRGCLGHESPTRWPTRCLALVVAAGPRPGELPWLADLPLPDDEGEPAPAASSCCPAPCSTRRRPGAGRPAGPRAARAVGCGRAGSRGRARRPPGLRDDDVLLDRCRRRRARARRRGRLGAGAARACCRPTSSPWSRRSCSRCATSTWCATTPGTSCSPVAGDRELRRAVVEPTLRGARRRPTARRAVVHRLVVAGARAAGRPAPDVVPRWRADLDGLYDPVPASLRRRGRRRVARGDRRADVGLVLLAAPGGADDLLDRLAEPARPVARLRCGSTPRSPPSTPPGSSRLPGCGCAPTWSWTRPTRSC